MVPPAGASADDTSSMAPDGSHSSLRSRLIGTWTLESYTAYPMSTSAGSSPLSSRPIYPMSKAVRGHIMYTPDGYVSAQMVIPGQKPFPRDESADAAWAQAGRRSFTYSGPFYITNEGGKEVLQHTMQVCNLPNWTGQVQGRDWRFEEDGQLLILSTEDGTEIKGELRRPELRWRRVKDNSRNQMKTATWRRQQASSVYRPAL